MKIATRYVCAVTLALFLLYALHFLARDDHGEPRQTVTEKEKVIEETERGVSTVTFSPSCLEAQGTKIPSDLEARDVLLFVLVISAPNAVNRRQAIRRTWKRLLPGDAVLRFAIGTLNVPQMGSLIQEAEFYNDVALLKDLPESYDALSDKVLAAFTWAWWSLKFRFLMKADDDTFARVDVLANELRTMSDEGPPLYWGFFDGRQVPKRHGKWKETDFVLCDRFLPYAKGGGYVLSAKLVGYMACNAHGLQRFRSEDVSVGVWLAPYKQERRHDVRFDTEFVSRGCDNRFVVTHKQSETDMDAKYAQLQRSGDSLCGQETRRRGSYKYRWDLPPSQCCQRLPKADRSIP